MSELRQEFLKQTISNLETLQSEISLSDEFLRQYFRTLHTIKGTSRIFILNNLAKLAHEIENLIQAFQNNQIVKNNQVDLILRDGINHLVKLAKGYQQNAQTLYPQEFADKIRKLLPPEIALQFNLLEQHQILKQFTSQLSTVEKTNLGRAISVGKNFYLFESFFALADFDDQFKRLKQILNQKGEVVAVAPALSENVGETIGFRIFYVSRLVKAEFEELIGNFQCKIVFADSTHSGMFGNAIADAKIIAQLLNKNVVFETSPPEIEVSDRDLLLFESIAIQLIRNALDHGIETADERSRQGKNPLAKIEISLKVSANELLLQVKDDGRGIDAKKITQIARAKGFLSENESLNEKSAIKFIFTHRFSTSETVSEISGRGVGLDAVKDLVEKSGGRIEVETKTGKGTIFSVYLAQS